MGLSTNTYTYSGGSKQFSATFADGYIEQSHVTAYVVGAVDGLGDQVYLNFTWTSESQITVTDSLTVGDEVTVERTVPKDNVLVDLDENGAITREGLSRNNRQALHAVHEVFDGRLENNLISAVNSLLERVNAIDTQVALVEGLAEDTLGYSLAAAQSALSAALVANSAATLLRNSTIEGDGGDTYPLEHDLPIGLVFIDGVQQNWDAFVQDQAGKEILFAEDVPNGAQIEILYSAGTAAYSTLTFEDRDSFFTNDTISYSNTAVGSSVVSRQERFAWVVAASDATDHHVTANGVKYYVEKDADGHRPINALNPNNDGTTSDAAVFAKAMEIGGAWVGSGEYFVDSLQTGTVSFQLYGDFVIKHSKNAGALRLAPELGSSVTVSSIGANTQYPAITGNLSTPLTVSSTSGLVRGGVCLLRSTDVYGYGNGVPKAEIVRILEISGSTVYTHGIIEDSYSTSITLTPLSDAKMVVDGPTFTVKEDVYAATTPYGYRGSLELVGCVDAKVNVTVRNGLGAGVATYSCWKPVVKVAASDLRDKSASNALGYGAVAGAATNYGDFTVIATRCRHAFTDGDYGGLTAAYDGVPRNCTVRGVATNCTAAAWDTHAESHNQHFDGCEAYAGNGDADTTAQVRYGFQIRSRNATLTNPKVRGMSGLYLIQNHNWGEASLTTIINPDFAIGNGGSAVPFSLIAHAQAEARKIVFQGGSFEGSPSIDDDAPEIEIIGTIQRGVTNFRLGQNNKLTAIGLSRISDGNISEGIVVDAGSTLHIDNHFIKTGPSGFIGGGKVILTGSNAGTATVYLGKITEAAAVGGSVTWVSEQTTTLSLQPLPSVMTALAVGDVQSPAVSGVVRVATRYEVGASGQGQTNSFTTTDGKTITVTGGIITGVA